MKPSLQLLKTCIKAVADARNVEFGDYANDEQHLSVHTDTIPAQADVRTICEVLFGTSRMMEKSYGYIIVWTDEAPFKEGELDPVDEAKLRMALPYGTKL